ncbi:kinetochore protein Spc25 [Boleophthalmus pectinirostris]|uniref:kinetochore protein Spc25 n=1 Tax=Boleophthalmus pectinirostris TaxID=150288 RepID=UPI000A1C4B57|nr:kinetochore protein Spc25 [Boleophthalmus pectinirostris]
MMSITDPGTSEYFAKAMEEIHSQHLKALGKITDMTTELSQTHKQFIKSAQDTCIKKCKDDEMLFDTIESFKKDLEQKGKLLKDKRLVISEVMSEIEQKDMKKEEIIHKIEKLKEEQAKRRDVIDAQNKANKKRLKNLQKARYMFQEHLGLEIRAIMGKAEVSRGEKLQFIFRNINRADLTSTYIVTMGINAEGAYQVVSSDPALDCLPDLEKRLQETNNLAAFLANIRKEFVSLARH